MFNPHSSRDCELRTLMSPCIWLGSDSANSANSASRSSLSIRSNRTPEIKSPLWFFLRILTVSSFAVLTSCSFAPIYSVPNVGESNTDKWRDDPWVEAKPSDATDKGQWWKLFNDAYLDQLEETLEKGSPSLAIALAKYDQATAYLKQAESQELPTVDASGSTTQNRQSRNRPLRGSNQPDYYNAYTGMLTTNYEIDFWGRVRGLVASAKAQAQASAGDLQTEKLSLQSKLAQIYFQLRGNDKQIAVLAESIKAYDRALVLIKNRYEAGIASGVDLARAQTQLSTAKAEVSELSIQRALYEHAIAVLVGAPSQAFTVAPTYSVRAELAAPFVNAANYASKGAQNERTESGRARDSSSISPEELASYLKALQVVDPPQVPTALPSTLLQRRPDVAAAERRAAAANQRIGVAKAAFYPSFSIGASAGYQNTGGPAWMSEPNSVWSIGPAASFNLFDNGLRRAQLSIAKSALEQSGGEYRLVVLTAFQQVEDAMVKLKEYKVETRDRALAAFAADRAMRLSTSRYKDGAVNYLEVITAQTAALQAERSLITLDTSRLITSIELIKALGGGWSKGSLGPDVSLRQD